MNTLDLRQKIESVSVGVALSLLLSFLMIFFGAPLSAAIVFLLIFFIPGYLIATRFTHHDAIRTILSFPLSLTLNGIYILAASLVVERPADEFAIIIPLLVAIILYARAPLCIISDARWSFSVNKKWLTLGLLFITLLSFYVHVTHVGKSSFAHEYPINVVGFDRSVQLSWVASIAESGRVTLPPSLHNGAENVFSGFLTPIPLYSTGLFARFSGASFGNAQNIFSTVVFVFTALSIFLLVNYFAGTLTALTAGILVSSPTIYFFAGEIAGILRLPITVLFFPLLLMVLFQWSRREKNSPLLVGILLAGFTLTHPVMWPLLIVPLIWSIISTLRSTTWKNALVEFSVAFGIPLAALLLFLDTALRTFTSEILRFYFEWTHPLYFDNQTANLVGPLLRVSHYFIVLVAVTLIGLVILHRLLTKKDPYPIRSQYLGVSFLFLFILTAGVNMFYFNYTGKMRHILLMGFLLPALAWGLVRIAQKAFTLSRFPQNKKWFMILPLAAALIIGAPWNVQHNIATEKIDLESWNTLVWLQDNTPKDASVIAVIGYYQHSYLLGQRAGKYVGDNPDFIEISRGKPFDYAAYCIPGFTRQSLFATQPAPCDSVHTNLESYDYILSDFSFTDKSIEGTIYVRDYLLEKGFVTVYVNADAAVFKNLARSK